MDGAAAVDSTVPPALCPATLPQSADTRLAPARRSFASGGFRPAARPQSPQASGKYISMEQIRRYQWNFLQSENHRDGYVHHKFL